MPIKNWSITPASNNSASPNGAPEGMAPSTVNDIFRQQMADHKTQWLDAEWFDHGDSGISRASATTFKITTDVTGEYLANRRIKLYDATTLYGTVASSSYSAPDTTVTVTMDSGALTASLSSVALAILRPTNQSIPTVLPTLNTLTVAGAATISGAVDFKTTLNVEGAVTLSGAATLKGITTLESACTMKSTLNVEGATTLSGAVTMKSTLTVGGTSITGAPFIDSTAIIKGSGDATKLVRIEADGITTGTTRVWTALDRDTNIGNNWEFIASATASTSATIDFSSIAASSYARHLIVFNDVIPASNATILWFRMSTGASFKSGASDYQWVMYAASSGGAGATSSTGAAQIALSDATNTLGTGSHQVLSGQICIFNAANASEYKRVHASSSWISSGGLPVVNMSGGVFQFTGACDGFRFLMSSGNLASGTFYLYGQRTAA